VSGSETAHRNDVNVFFDRLLGGFLRGLEERADVRVNPEVGVAGDHDLGAAIMSVLSHFCDEDAWAASSWMTTFYDTQATIPLQINDAAASFICGAFPTERIFLHAAERSLPHALTDY